MFRKIASRTELQRQWTKDTRIPLKRAASPPSAPSGAPRSRRSRRTSTTGRPRLTVTMINYDGKAAPAARPGGGKADDSAARWRDALARNPWVEEALLVLQDAEK